MRGGRAAAVSCAGRERGRGGGEEEEEETWLLWSTGVSTDTHCRG